MSFSSKIRSTTTKIATSEDPKQKDNKTYDDISPKGRSRRSTGTTGSKGSGSDLARFEEKRRFQQLTRAELLVKRRKGLCLTCDQKFTPGHRCASGTVQIQTFADMVDSSHMEGFNGDRLMKLKGILGQEEIIVMIDCGTSNNLISLDLVERLGIATVNVNSDEPLSCVLPSGETFYHQGSICVGVIISFPELQVVEDFVPCKMGCNRYDAILGVQWLKKLDDVIVDWELYTMKFVTENGEVTLEGDPELCPSSKVPAKMVDNDINLGDFVFLKRYHKGQQTESFYGPYKIIKQVGKVGHVLDVPNAQIRALFHIDQLEKARITDSAYPSLPLDLTKGMEMLTPEEVVEVRCEDSKSLATCEVLIKWKNYEPSWELFSIIEKEFPEFKLEEKLKGNTLRTTW